MALPRRRTARVNRLPLSFVVSPLSDYPNVETNMFVVATCNSNNGVEPQRHGGTKEDNGWLGWEKSWLGLCVLCDLCGLIRIDLTAKNARSAENGKGSGGLDLCVSVPLW